MQSQRVIKCIMISAKMIETYRNDASYKLLNSKYKLFLWSFGRADWIHKIGARLSYLAKQVRS